MAKAEVDTNILALAAAIKASPQAKGPAVGDFCKLWEQVKPILEALQPMAKLVPVVGALISAALATLLTLGSAAHAALCGK